MPELTGSESIGEALSAYTVDASNKVTEFNEKN